MTDFSEISINSFFVNEKCIILAYSSLIFTLNELKYNNNDN